MWPLVCNLCSAEGKSWPVTGVLQHMKMDFVCDWIAACVLRDVAFGCLRCITGCGCWIVTFVEQDVATGVCIAGCYFSSV
jgi:hypothetical protein